MHIGFKSGTSLPLLALFALGVMTYSIEILYANICIVWGNAQRLFDSFVCFIETYHCIYVQ